MTRDPHDPQDLMTLAEAAKASGVPKRIIASYWASSSRSAGNEARSNDAISTRRSSDASS
jgi:hypothetical protein